MKLTCIIFLVFSSSALNAQTYDFGNIPKDQLEMEFYEKDSTANAVVIFDKGEAEVNFRNNEFWVLFKRHVRIKILTDEGLEKGNIEIIHRTSEPRQNVRRIKAESYTLTDSNDILKSSVGRRDRYEEKVSEDWSQIKFTIPGLKKGSIFEYSYEVSSNHPTDFPDWFFQREIPVIWSEYTTLIPEWFNYLTVTRGYHPYHETKRTTYPGTILYRDGYANSAFHYQGNQYYYAMKDIPAIAPEPHMKVTTDYLSHLRFKLSTFKPPYSSAVNFLTNWSDFSNRLINHSEYGGRLKSSSKLKNASLELTKDADSEFEKMKNIYDHISDIMIWNNRRGVFPTKELEEAYQEGTGNGAEINFILIQMLREAGLEAHPLILSTRTHGEVIRLFPLVEQFNHTITYVEADSTYYLLDAKDEMRPYNLLSENSLNGEGLLVRPGQPLWIPLTNRQKNSVLKLLTININENGEVEGTLSTKNEGYFAFNTWKNIDSSNLNNSIKEQVFYNEAGLSVDSVKIIESELNRHLYYETHFHKSEHEFTDILYLNPMTSERIQDNPFRLKERTYPVEYEYGFDRKMIININIPEAWEIDEIPQSVLHRLPNQNGEFRRLVQVIGNNISIQFLFRIEKERFMPDEYELLRDMYNQMISRSSENIVLRKNIE